MSLYMVVEKECMGYAGLTGITRMIKFERLFE